MKIDTINANFILRKASRSNNTRTYLKMLVHEKSPAE